MPSIDPHQVTLKPKLVRISVSDACVVMCTHVVQMLYSRTGILQSHVTMQHYHNDVSETI